MQRCRVRLATVAQRMRPPSAVNYGHGYGAVGAALPGWRRPHVHVQLLTSVVGPHVSIILALQDVVRDLDAGAVLAEASGTLWITLESVIARHISARPPENPAEGACRRASPTSQRLTRGSKARSLGQNAYGRC